MEGSIFYEVDFGYFRVVRSGCGSMVAAGGHVLVEDVVEQCFWGAVLKGLVKKVANLVGFDEKMVRFWGVRAVGVLVEKWDTEDLDAWGQVQKLEKVVENYAH